MFAKYVKYFPLTTVFCQIFSFNGCCGEIGEITKKGRLKSRPFRPKDAHTVVVVSLLLSVANTAWIGSRVCINGNVARVVKS
jgi:hypothetical protein